MNLVGLNGIDITSKQMLQAVTSICPHLREVGFFKSENENDNDVIDRLSVDELKIFLSSELNPSSCFLKVFDFIRDSKSAMLYISIISYVLQVHHVRFNQVPLDYRQALLSTVGHQLLKLVFHLSKDIDFVAELSPCILLEELLILPRCTFLPPSVAAEFPSTDAFLPRLNKFRVHCCLGRWSSLFECHRPMLTFLHLACPHFAVASRSQFNWSEIPQLWPNMRHLYLHNPGGLTVDLLREAMPQMKCLQLIGLPRYFHRTAKELKEIKVLASQLRNQLRDGPSFGFHNLIVPSSVDH